ncbi:MAG: PAS domain S-box protein [Desulfobacteraceae bacterium]|nr:PAS domain S-box protein [Desulfobacteraceae bacterium]
MKTSAPITLKAKTIRIICLFGVLFFIIIYGMTTIEDMIMKKKALGEAMEGAAGTATALVKDYIYQYKDYTQRLIDKSPRGPSADDKNVAEFFIKNPPPIGPTDAYYILNRQGCLICANRNGKTFTGLDLSNLGYIKDSSQGLTVHQSVFTLRPVVSISYELPDGRRLFIDKDITGLINIIKHIRLAGFDLRQKFFVLSGNGTVIYHPDKTLMAERYNLGFELRDWSGKDWSGLETYSFRGTTYLCYKKAFNVPAGWVFYASIPYSEAFISALRAITIYSIFLAALSLGLLLVLGRQIDTHLSRPIERLSRYLASFNPLTNSSPIADKMAAGTFELSEIITASNMMFEKIRASHEKLAENERLFRIISESASDCIFWQDPDKRFIYISPACKEISGYEPEEYYKNPGLMSEIVHPDDRPLWLDHEEVAPLRQPHKPIECRIITKDGQIKWIRHVCKSIYNDNQFLGIRGSNADITEKKALEETLFEKNEALTVTLESIGDGVIATDKEGRITLFNRMAQEITGWEQSETAGRPLQEVFNIINEKTGLPCENPVEKVIMSGLIIGLANHTVLITKDGARRAIEDSGAPIRNENGRIIGVVLVFRDVTKKRRTETELLKIERLESIGLLAGGIAHDFNNLLTAILGNVSLAKIYAENDPRTLSRLNAAERASLRAKELAGQLLTFTKGGAPVKGSVHMAGILKESAAFALQGANVTCAFDIDDMPPVEADPGQLSQVLNNIIINAKQAMPSGGVIKITCKKIWVSKSDGLPLTPGDYVKISISDEGGGIPWENLKKIFDPYFTTKKEGSGLGLTTSLSIVKRHNGHISVESQVGKGSTFNIFLPASCREKTTGKEEQEAGRTEREALDAAPQGGRVLVMDDEEAIGELTSEALKSLGYEPSFAKNGEEAVKIYQSAMDEERPFNAVIMDLTIAGGMGGKEAVSEILKIDPDARVVVSSGYSEDPVMARFGQYGFKAALPKPYKINQLDKVLRNVIKAKD